VRGFLDVDKMRQKLSSVTIGILRKTVPTSEKCVYIEGGLGSQILGLLKYKLLLESDPKTYLDARYFYSHPSLGVKVWKWELTEYGHQLPTFNNSLKAKLQYVARESTAKASELNLSVWKNFSLKKFNHLFPIHASTFELMKEFCIAENEDFSAIHIRRGDYLSVSSKVIELDEYAKVVRRLSTSFGKKVLVFSDDPFSESDKLRLIKSCSGELIFITGMNQHGIHGLMRFASTLVTSNSTFSLSAALLSEKEDPNIIAPTLFFSNDFKEINLLIQQLSSWMYIEKRHL
jgi:hypothetical protein